MIFGPGAERECGIGELPRLSETDIAIGWVPGFETTRTSTDQPGAVEGPVAALRSSIQVALARPPCVVSFSGGRDSSLILALAADIARRTGLRPPVAVTFMYPGDPDAEESAFQEEVIRHLGDAGLPIDWQKTDIIDEFDLVGRLTAPLLRAHGGPLWPSAVGPSVALATYAAGGSVLTGEFGDEVVGPQRMTYLMGAVRRRGLGLSRSDWSAVGLSALPRSLASRRVRDSLELRPWLTSAGRTVCAQLERSDARLRPLRWDRSVRHWMGRRSVHLGNQTMDRIGQMYGCRFVHPLGDLGFVASYASYGGWRGVASRSSGTRLLADGLLPDSVVRRRSKSSFNRSRFGEPTRRFLAGWSGSGVNDALVDVDRLRAMWAAGDFFATSALLLQQAWLADHGEGES